MTFDVSARPKTGPRQSKRGPGRGPMWLPHGDIPPWPDGGPRGDGGLITATPGLRAKERSSVLTTVRNLGTSTLSGRLKAGRPSAFTAQRGGPSPPAADRTRLRTGGGEATALLEPRPTRRLIEAYVNRREGGVPGQASPLSVNAFTGPVGEITPAHPPQGRTNTEIAEQMFISARWDLQNRMYRAS